MNYLIYSNSYRLTNDEVEKITKDITNITKFDLLFDELDNIIEEAAYYSLFDEKKAVIVRNALCFTKTKEKYNEEILLNYLRNSNPNTILIFITNNSVDNTKDITKEIKNQKGFIEIKQPTYKDTELKIKSIIEKNKFKIKQEDVSYIVNASLKNYDLALNNIEKIMLYYDEPCQIEHKDIVNLTSNTLEDNSFKFIEATTDKNIKDAIKILNDLITYKTDLIMVTGTLINEYKNIIKATAYKESGYSNTEIEKALGKKDWQITKFFAKATKYRKNELVNCLKSLIELDYQLKNGEIDPITGLQLFILAL